MTVPSITRRDILISFYLGLIYQHVSESFEMKQEQVENVTDKTNIPFTLSFSSHLVLSRQKCKLGIKTSKSVLSHSVSGSFSIYIKHKNEISTWHSQYWSLRGINSSQPGNRFGIRVRLNFLKAGAWRNLWPILHASIWKFITIENSVIDFIRVLRTSGFPVPCISYPWDLCNKVRIS